MPLMCAPGVTMSFYSTFLPEIIEKSLKPNLTKEEVNEYTSYVLITLGIFEMLSGYVTSLIADKFNLYFFNINFLLVFFKNNRYKLATLGTLL
jgi:hypothetical protein